MHSDRPRLRFGALCVFVAGVAAGWFLPRWSESPAGAALTAAAPGAEARVRELGLELPPVATPVATYVPAARVGNTLYVSGHGPRRADGSPWTGKVGDDLTLEEGNAAGRAVGLRVLGTVRHALGSLDKVVRVVKVLGMVNCTSDFKEQPKVVNGFSDLMVEVFGKEAGTAARSAVGMNALPGGIPIEVEAIFEVRD